MWVLVCFSAVTFCFVWTLNDSSGLASARSFRLKCLRSSFDRQDQMFYALKHTCSFLRGSICLHVWKSSKVQLSLINLGWMSALRRSLPMGCTLFLVHYQRLNCSLYMKCGYGAFDSQLHPWAAPECIVYYYPRFCRHAKWPALHPRALFHLPK